MRILYDGQIYARQTAGGINRYFNNIIPRLPNNFVSYLTTYKSREINYSLHPQLKVFKCLKLRPRRIFQPLEEIYFSSVDTSINAELAHPTYYSLLTGKGIDNYHCPVVLTVHDMIYELFCDQLDYSRLEVENKRRAIQAADAIICVSENTKKDLLQLYSLPEEKVTVTYLASEIDASLAHGPDPVPSRPYYFYVGSRAIYKNFDGLLSAFAKTVSINAEIALCVVGSHFNKAEEKLIAELKLTDRIEYYGHVSDNHLAKLYRCSMAFVYPSLYEGFGIPPLEAMSCGTAVVASNCSSIPEIVGDAGLLFEPKSVGDLADILLFLLDNSLERDRLIAKGKQRTQAFSWDKTAAQTIEVYRSFSN